ncbi:MAG: hypothetical protein WDW36_006377 [Sanguina aurantia]
MEKMHKVKSSAIIVHPKFRLVLCTSKPKQLPTTRKPASLLALPQDALRLIAAGVAGGSAKDLVSLKLVSQRCRVLASDNALWRSLTLAKFSVPRGREPPSWEALYRYNHELFHTYLLCGAMKEDPGGRRLDLGAVARMQIAVTA